MDLDFIKIHYLFLCLENSNLKINDFVKFSVNALNFA